MRIAIVVGEVSGDLLGASLIRALQKQVPDLVVEGVVGPELEKAGAKKLFHMSELTVMGLVEALIHIPRLYVLRHKLISHFLNNPPDLFIGIDSPDFNLGLEMKLRARGIKVVHYVSPSIWAWREGRVKTIKKAVDLMLTLFPFETAIYNQHQIPVCFTGHPFADQIPLEIQASKSEERVARKKLGFSEEPFGFSGEQLGFSEDLGFSNTDKVIGLFPGSRDSELEFLGESVIRTAAWMHEKDPKLKFVLAVTQAAHQAKLESFVKEIKLPIQYVVGNARLAMAACDLALVTSGTATLELMLYKKPMVIIYRVNSITFQIAKRLFKLPYIGLPNILSGSHVVPEFIQDVQPEKLGAALFEWLNHPERIAAVKSKFTANHQALRKDAAREAAEAVLKLLIQQS